jgi:hypothetical protein
MKPRRHFKLIADNKLLSIYTSLVEASIAAEYYQKIKGVMPRIESYIKVI